MIGILVLSAVLAVPIPWYPVLAFEAANSGKVIAYVPVQSHETFAIRSIHSIHRTPVTDSYAIQGRLIVQRETRYESYGVGMPSNAEGSEQFRAEDGQYIISGMNRAFREIDLRVARVTASQELLLGDRAVALASFAGTGAWVRMKVRHVNGWRLLQGGNLIEPSESHARSAG